MTILYGPVFNEGSPLGKALEYFGDARVYPPPVDRERPDIEDQLINLKDHISDTLLETLMQSTYFEIYRLLMREANKLGEVCVKCEMALKSCSCVFCAECSMPYHDCNCEMDVCHDCGQREELCDCLYEERTFN